jgi:hypothetical protein
MRTIGKLVVALALLSAVAPRINAQTNTFASDQLLDLLIKKGYVSEDEAKKVRAEAAVAQTNNTDFPRSKWSIGNGIKNGEFFGDVRLRYENRTIHTPNGSRFELDRLRYAARVGLRADLVDDFYFGLRLETASNPRSSWVNFATSTSGTPYSGPFGKASAGIGIGEIYIGYKPKPWLDVTLGKMPNPLYATSMLWDPDINPEGAAERFNFKVGEAELFATFGQFYYEDVNPTRSVAFLVPTMPGGTDAPSPWLFAWQLGANYHINHDLSAKAAATLYNYTSHGANSQTGSSVLSPGFNGPYVGEGATNFNGSSGFPSGPNDGFAFNQTGINDLLVLDFPFELNFKISDYRARFFGDFAMNLDGADRARAAVNGAANNTSMKLTLPLQKNDDKAYQFGLAFANGDNINTVNNSNNHRGGWETRVYWQHVEQYAIDPNLMDSDFFEGRENLEGVYVAAAYSMTDNIIGTVRFGHAWRINPALGTGGANQDIPFINPIRDYQIIQADLNCKF